VGGGSSVRLVLGSFLFWVHHSGPDRCLL